MVRITNFLPSTTYPKPEQVELIPVAHFYTKSLWMDMYMEYLRRSKGCMSWALWMDTRRGILCSGPAGPLVSFPGLLKDESALRALPSTLDMLEEGTSVAFFSKFGSIMDAGVLDCAWRFYEHTYLDDLYPKTTEDHQHKDNNRTQPTTNYPYLEHLWRNPPHHLPIDIISGLRFDTVYLPSLESVARWPPEAPGLWRWNVSGLVEETRVDRRSTRFKLAGQGEEVRVEARFDVRTFCDGWLSQSSHVLHFLEMTGHQESFSIVDPPWLSLRSQSTRLASSGICDAVEEPRPIYLFLYLPLMTVSDLISWMGGHTHFWSFDEDGQSRIPEKEWERWDIPILTSSVLYDPEGLLSWPSHIYTALHKWQIARGFDPSTAHWAQHMDYPELEIIKKQPESSWWNRLWSAVPDLDISACAC